MVLNVLAIWNDFLLPSLVLKQNKQNFTLPLSTYAFYGTYSVDYGMIMAALVLTTFPVIVLYLFCRSRSSAVWRPARSRVDFYPGKAETSLVSAFPLFSVNRLSFRWVRATINLYETTRKRGKQWRL